jgi:cystathionine beta-synthase
MQTTNLLKLIGNTPIVEIKTFQVGKCRLFLKLENQNPGGSIKDRVALSMIEAAEKDGKIKKGGTLIEATAGNTGLGLALVAAQKGYNLTLVIPDKMSTEKIMHLRAMGAKVVLTRSDVPKGHPEYYQEKAQQIANETPGSFYINQFSNPANPLSHETTTGPEIWEQMGHEVDAVVCGVGSGGTLAGLSRYFSKAAPQLELVLADPKGSILTDYIKTGKLGEAGSWLVEGIGEDFIPGVCDLSRVKSAYTITDKESFMTARELLAKNGIFGGSSSGTLIAAAVKYCQDQTVAKNVLTFVCDSGNKYLSKMYNDYWMKDQGFLETKSEGNLKDLISRKFQDGTTVTVNPDDTLSTSYLRMKAYEISQLPVVKNGKLVGILDESDILMAVMQNSRSFKDLVEPSMTKNIETISPNTDLKALHQIFQQGKVAVVTEGESFLGLVTRIDLLNYLRRTQGSLT